MNATRLLTAMKEAERFLDRAHLCLRADAEARHNRFAQDGISATDPTLLGSQSGTAAVRRASMDLSAALTDLRKFPRRR